MHSLTPVLDGGEWSASRSGRFTLRERALGTHWIGGWVGPRAVLDAMVKRNVIKLYGHGHTHTHTHHIPTFPRKGKYSENNRQLTSSMIEGLA
jgi:hypothetical protein